MIQDHLQSIVGVSIYPIISLVVFVVFFAALIIWVFKVDKNYIKKMENLPLETEGKNNFNKTGDSYENKV